MRRALLLACAFAAITYVEFEVFPGHTYLEGRTQLYVPMLERLDTPGYLSRDLVATHPNLSYTIYDEVALFLHKAGRLNFKTALLAQQVAFRAAAIIGVYLLTSAAGIGELWALLIAALVNLGTILPGPEVALVSSEPVPAGFAFALSVLAMGCLADEKPLLCGLAGGLAFLYDPVIAAVLWITVLIAFLADRRLRRLIRPTLTIFVVFVLLLANLAQLQPGMADSDSLFARIPSDVAEILRTRTHYAWVSLWGGRGIWIYLFILISGLWAVAQMWPRLNRQLRWLFLAPSLLGILSVPVSALLLAQFDWWLVPRLQLARWLLFTVEFSLIACAAAAIQALRVRHKAEMLAWSVFIVAVLVLPRFTGPLVHRVPDREAVTELARWAEANTWGSSMFFFPDAGRGLYPGVFRAESRRALWVDWMSGAQADYSGELAKAWDARWRRDAAAGFSAQRLHDLLALPIDYYVLKRPNLLPAVKPVFENREFVVYDAHDLLAAARR